MTSVPDATQPTRLPDRQEAKRAALPRPTPAFARRRSSLAVAPPLEPHLRHPLRPRLPGPLERWELALQVDARLALRSRVENRIVRARAAVARRLLQSRAHEAAGYSHFRDYAREELGQSLRSLQELARLDRSLESLPLLDAAVQSGRLSPSRVMTLVPIATAENERFWLRQARKQTHRELAKRVRIARETLPGPPQTDRGSDQPPSATAERPPREASERPAGILESLPNQTPAAILQQRKPRRSQMLWEAFVEESSRQTGRSVSEGEALEILLAEFWPLVPRAAIQILDRREKPPIRTTPTNAEPGVILPGHVAALAEDALFDHDLEWERFGPGGSDETSRIGHESSIGHESAAGHEPATGDKAPAANDVSDFILCGPDPRQEWYRRRIAWFEKEYGPWKDLRLSALQHARTAAARSRHSCSPGESSPRESGEAQPSANSHSRAMSTASLLDLSTLDTADAAELERRFLALRTLERRLTCDQAALLFLVRKRQFHRTFGFASFGHYVRERFGLSRRTADHRANLYWLLYKIPPLLRAYCDNRISESALPLFHRLRELNLKGRDLRAWVRRAGEVPVVTFRDQVRWLEARREAWRSLRPTTADEELRLPDFPTRPPTYREWTHARQVLNASPEALAYVATGYAEFEQMSARGPESARIAQESTQIAQESTQIAPESTRIAPEGSSPLIPSVDEPATQTTRLFAPVDVVKSYRDAMESVRVIYGDNKPAWWCLDAMMLHVRREWAQHARYSRRNTKNYEILARDGFRCTTPGCSSRRNLHGHHTELLSEGGPDEPWNITTLCEACHLFGVHRAGFVRVRGRAPGRLVWELGRVQDEQGRVRPYRRHVGEFRR